MCNLSMCTWMLSMCCLDSCLLCAIICMFTTIHQDHIDIYETRSCYTNLALFLSMKPKPKSEKNLPGTSCTPHMRIAIVTAMNNPWVYHYISVHSFWAFWLGSFLNIHNALRLSPPSKPSLPDSSPELYAVHVYIALT